MKSSILFCSLICLLALNSCGPAAENREAMHLRAKAFQDSIAFVIRSSMEEAATPGPGQPVVPVPSQSAAPVAGQTAPAASNSPQK